MKHTSRISVSDGKFIDTKPNVSSKRTNNNVGFKLYQRLTSAAIWTVTKVF